MKNPTKTLIQVGPAVLFALLAVGALAGPALALPLPVSLAVLVVVLLGLRVGVTLAAVEGPSETARPAAPRADVRAPALRHAG